MLERIIRFFSKRTPLFIIWLFPLLFLYFPFAVDSQSKLAADSTTLLKLRYIADAYLPSGLSDLEMLEYFKNHGSLEERYISVINWPGGPYRSESIVKEAQDEYFIGFILFLATEIIVITFSLLIFEYKRAKVLKFLEKVGEFILTLNDKFRTFFQIICSLNFAVSFFTAGQALNLVRRLRDEIFSYFDMYYLPFNETSRRFWIIWTEGWHLLQCYWLFYMSFFSGILLLIAIFFSDTEIIPKKVCIPFILLKPTVLLLFFVQILSIIPLVRTFIRFC